MIKALSPNYITVLLFSATIISGCSFIELHPGAKHIIFANDDSCELVEHYKAEVPTENAFISRTPKAISEELQILAQNAAFEVNANAIWPTSEISEGTQSFKLLRCER